MTITTTCAVAALSLTLMSSALQVRNLDLRGNMAIAHDLG